MNELDRGHLIAAAQSQIERFLNDLEVAVGRPILSAELISLDVTRLMDQQQRVIRQFRILITPPPNSIGAGQ